MPLANYGLETLIEWYILTDDAAVANLPTLLSSLKPDIFDCQDTQLTRWSRRINDLLHAKQSKFRWAGLCIALATALNSRKMMLEQASNWIQIGMNSVPRDENPAVQLAAMRLLDYIYASAQDLLEFQRHIVSPTIAKFSNQLLSFMQKNQSSQHKTQCCRILTNMILQYPSLHRALQGQILTFCRHALSSCGVKNEELSTLIELYSSLPVLAGKVGSTSQWRTCFDEHLKEASASLVALRTTYKGSSRLRSERSIIIKSPRDSLELLRQLHVQIAILCSLLHSRVTRQVHLPVGGIIHLVFELLQLNGDEDLPEGSDARSRALEVTCIRAQIEEGCTLLLTIAKSIPYILTPYLSILTSTVAVLLEKNRSYGHILIPAIKTSLQHSPPIHDGKIAARLLRAVIPTVTRLLPSTADRQASDPPTKIKKRKRKGDWSEGEELLRSRKRCLLSNAEDSAVAKSTLDVFAYLLTSTVPPHLRTLCCRTLLNLSFAMPRIHALNLSNDIELHMEMQSRVSSLCATLLCNTPGFTASTLGLFEASVQMGTSATEVSQQLELTIHPQLPPMHLATTTNDFNLLLTREGPEESESRSALLLSGTNKNARFLNDSQSSEMETEVILECNSQSQVVPPASTVSSVPINFAFSKEKVVANLSNVVTPGTSNDTSSNTSLFLSLPLYPSIPSHRVAKFSQRQGSPLEPLPEVTPRSKLVEIPPAPSGEVSEISKPIRPIALTTEGDEEDDEPFPEINMESSDDELK